MSGDVSGAWWLAGMAALVVAMVTVPFVREALETTRLTGAQWALVVVGALVGGGCLELVSAAAARISGFRLFRLGRR